MTNSKEKLNICIKEITSIKYHYNIDDIIDPNERETLINYYLEQIKNKGNKEIFKDNVNTLMDTLDFFSNIKTHAYLEETAEDISMNLIDKVLNNIIELPIKLDNIIKYYYDTELTSNEQNYITNWIILVLSIITYLN